MLTQLGMKGNLSVLMQVSCQRSTGNTNHNGLRPPGLDTLTKGQVRLSHERWRYGYGQPLSSRMPACPFKIRNKLLWLNIINGV